MKMLSALLSAISANLIYFILHIQNTSSFPKPLSPKEEQKMLEKMKNGDTRDLLFAFTYCIENKY